MRQLIFALAASVSIAAQAQQTTGFLVADGNSAGTYSLIRSCGFEEEVPDNSRDHSTAPFQHITQQQDAVLGKPVFVFHIHSKIDDDRGKTNITDRQRNEIKTDSKSPASMVAQDGETMVMRWKFKLPAGMKTTRKFTHIHQLKGLDNKQHTAEVGAPLMTFTCYSKGNKGQQVFRLRYDNRNADGSVTLAETDLAPFLGKWVEVEETVTFGAKGKYAVTIKNVKNGSEIFSYKNDDLDMWRTGCIGLRPKWGIYRYLGKNRENESLLRDEQLLFADFSIEKK